MLRELNSHTHFSIRIPVGNFWLKASVHSSLDTRRKRLGDVGVVLRHQYEKRENIFICPGPSFLFPPPLAPIPMRVKWFSGISQHVTGRSTQARSVWSEFQLTFHNSIASINSLFLGSIRQSCSARGEHTFDIPRSVFARQLRDVRQMFGIFMQPSLRAWWGTCHGDITSECKLSLVQIYQQSSHHIFEGADDEGLSITLFNRRLIDCEGLRTWRRHWQKAPQTIISVWTVAAPPQRTPTSRYYSFEQQTRAMKSKFLRVAFIKNHSLGEWWRWIFA